MGLLLIGRVFEVFVVHLDGFGRSVLSWSYVFPEFSSLATRPDCFLRCPATDSFERHAHVLQQKLDL